MPNANETAYALIHRGRFNEQREMVEGKDYDLCPGNILVFTEGDSEPARFSEEESKTTMSTIDRQRIQLLAWMERESGTLLLGNGRDSNSSVTINDEIPGDIKATLWKPGGNIQFAALWGRNKDETFALKHKLVDIGGGKVS